MAEQNNYTGIEHVIRLSSNEEFQCKLCAPLIFRGDFADNINHLMAKHNYKLLHIGPETRHANESGSWHYTVAILGI